MLLFLKIPTINRLRQAFFRPVLLAGTALAFLASAPAAQATGCCSDAAHAPVAPVSISEPSPAYMFQTPAQLRHLPKSTAGNGQFNHQLPHRLWLTGGVHAVPSAYLPTPETSNAERSAFSQAGLGLGYAVSPSLRAISSWHTGLNTTSVSRGSQFTLGVAWRH
jgi:hypothetical protein